MAPLSRQLAGLILPHDKFGNHLNKSGKCIDDDLEQKNFANAGQTLAQLWTELNIDGYPVLAEYKQPGGESDLPPDIDPEWYAVHVKESQYFLQVVDLYNSGVTREDVGEVKLFWGELSNYKNFYQTPKKTLLFWRGDNLENSNNLKNFL